MGQLHKADKVWTPEVIPAVFMRELVIAVEDGTITGTATLTRTIRKN